MNLAIRGIDFNLGREPADTFVLNQHKDLRADFILANPPFNISDWWHASLTGDARWQYGDPPAGNANYVWLLKKIAHELTESLRKNLSAGWSARESVQAKLRLMVKRILRKYVYKYPPDHRDAAVELVLEQAREMGEGWSV